MAVFRQFPRGNIIGTGNYVFRHYGAEQPVSYPYLCFTAEQADSSVCLIHTGTPTQGQVFYTSTNGINWEQYTIGTVISLNNGDKVYWKGDNTTVSESTSKYFYFEMTGKIAASGNIMSLLDSTCERVSVPDYCFYYLFKLCYGLTTAPALPATVLGNYCYGYMFYNCSSLTTAPALPATTLAVRCYESMFYNCWSLTTAPALPATTLAIGCYLNMFRSCSDLCVYSSPGTGYSNPWRIPSNGDASSYTFQGGMFYGTTGSYKRTDMVSLNTTFYTQNTPRT